jgi:hypothetical protein
MEESMTLAGLQWCKTQWLARLLLSLRTTVSNTRWKTAFKSFLDTRTKPNLFLFCSQECVSLFRSEVTQKMAASCRIQIYILDFETPSKRSQDGRNLANLAIGKAATGVNLFVAGDQRI